MPPPLILRVAQPVMNCPSPSSKPLGETLQMGQNHTQQQKTLPISHTRKISLANSSFRVINQYNLHLKLYSLLFYHFCFFIYFFITSGIMYTYFMLILINPWLLNLIFKMAKIMNCQNSSKQNFQPPSSAPFKAFWETLLQVLVIFCFTPSIFHFRLYKFLLTPLQLRLYNLRANQV